MTATARANLARLFGPAPPEEVAAALAPGDEEETPPPPLTPELERQLLADMERVRPSRRRGVLRWFRAAVCAVLAAVRPPSSD